MPDVELLRGDAVVGRVSFDWMDEKEFLIENIRVRIPDLVMQFTVVDNLKNPNGRRPTGGIAVKGVGRFYEVLEQVMLDAVASLRGISVRFPTKRKLPRRITEADSAPLLES